MGWMGWPGWVGKGSWWKIIEDLMKKKF